MHGGLFSTYIELQANCKKAQGNLDSKSTCQVLEKERWKCTLTRKDKFFIFRPLKWPLIKSFMYRKKRYLSSSGTVQVLQCLHHNICILILDSSSHFFTVTTWVSCYFTYTSWVFLPSFKMQTAEDGEKHCFTFSTMKS